MEPDGPARVLVVITQLALPVHPQQEIPQQPQVQFP
jgi:hypothetical protein